MIGTVKKSGGGLSKWSIATFTFHRERARTDL